MRSTQTCSGLFLALLLAGPLGAAPDAEQGVRTDFGISSKQVFRGLERAGTSAQALIEDSRENFRAGLWLNQSLADSQSREADLNVAWAWSGSDSLKLEATLRGYWLGGSESQSLRYSMEGGLQASLAPVNRITPSVDFYHDFRQNAETVQFSLARSFALTGFGAFLDTEVYVGGRTGRDWRPDEPGPGRRDSFCYWGAEAHLPYRIGPRTTVVAGLFYADAAGWSATNGPVCLSSGRNLWVSLSVSLDF